MQGQIQQAAQEWASLFTNWPWKKWLTKAPYWITILLIVLLAKSAADLTWLMFTPEPVIKQASTRHSTNRSNATQAQQVRLNKVVSMHLFGVAAKATAPTRRAPIETVKDTNLKLTLKGVFASDNPDKASAMIEDDKGKEKVYLRGDTIFPGVVLYEVHADKVILERGGNFEALNFQRDDEKKNGAVRRGRFGNRTSRYRDKIRQPAVAQPRTRTIRANSKIQKLRETLAQDPSKFMQEVRIEPQYDEATKQIKGFTFNHNDKQIMRALGLRSGDVITQVNGSPVSDPSVVSSLFTDLNSLSSLQLTVERNGRTEVLNIQM